jgi:N-methylhydantoinase A
MCRHDRVLHGSTIAINTVLERKGAKTALVTTAGFRDVYSIGRGNRIDAFNLFFHRPRPLVPRELTFEVLRTHERQGRCSGARCRRRCRSAREQAHESRVEAVAVCFLHSYANPKHEQRCRRNPAPEISRSVRDPVHEILREFREYERTSTTVLNAFVGPRVRAISARSKASARASHFTGKIASCARMAA